MNEQQIAAVVLIFVGIIASNLAVWITKFYWEDEE